VESGHSGSTALDHQSAITEIRYRASRAAIANFVEPFEHRWASGVDLSIVKDAQALNVSEIMLALKE